MKVTSLDNIPGMAIFIDFKKAFDSVDWNFLAKVLDPVVQRLDNAIHRINHYPVDSVVCFVNTYPLDSDLSSG